MQVEIESHIGCCLTIIFVNHTFDPEIPEVWVCQDRAAYDECLERLAKVPHCTILAQGPSLIQGPNFK